MEISSHRLNRNGKLGTGKKSNVYELCFFTSAGFHLQRAIADDATLKIEDSSTPVK